MVIRKFLGASKKKECPLGIHFVTFPCVLTLFYTVQSMLVVAFPAISSHTACEDLSDVRLDVVVHMSSFIHQNTLMVGPI